MAVLKTVKSRSLRLTMNKNGKTASKSYAQIGTDTADANIMETAKAIGSVMAYPVEDTELVTTETLKESV